MKFLALSANTADPRPFIDEESTRMAALIESGVVEQMYLKADYSGAVLIVNAVDAQAAGEHLSSLPLVQHNVTQFSLTPLAASPA